MSRGEPPGIFSEVMPTPAKKAKLPRMHLQGVDGDEPPPAKKAKKAPVRADDDEGDHEYRF